MSDVRLIVGVDTGASEKQILSDISGIIENINRTPQKIKIEFDIDKDALKNLADARKILESSVSSGKVLNFQETTQSAKTAASEVSNVTSKLSDITSKIKEINSEAGKTGQVVDNTSEAYIRVARSVESLQTKIINASKWTAALHSTDEAKKSYHAIQDLKSGLSNLDNQYKSGGISLEDYRAGVSKLNLEYQKQANVIREAGANHKSFWDKMGNITEVLARYFTMYKVFQTMVRTIRNMVNEVVRFDDAMTQLRVVTDNTEAEYSRFSKTVASTAREIGASITDLVDSTTTYARLGYSLEESSELSRYTAMLKNVGNIDVSSAQSAITAITKAYNIGADQIESVMDKLVEVGNNYPISVAQLAEGMNNAGSALAAAGNSFEESLALLTAANTTVQNISKASTGLRTIVARLRNTKTELDDLGEAMTTAQYDEIVQALTDYNVKLTDANGELRGTYEIFEDLSKAWGNMTSLEKSSLAKTLAGNRQQNVFFSLMDQFGEAEKAMKSIDNSSGALAEAYGEYMNSITAHVNQFKAAFTSLSDTIVNSSLVKFVVDSGTAILTIIDKIAHSIGSLNTLLLGGGATKTLITIITAIKALNKEGKAVNILSIIDKGFPTLSEAIKGVASSTNKAKASFSGLWSVMSAHPIFLTIAAITVLAKILDACNESFKEIQDRAMKSKTAYNKTTSEIDSLNSELEKNKSLIEEINSQDTITITDQAELDRLEKENNLLEAQLEIKREIAQIEGVQAASDANDVLTTKQAYTGASFDNTAFWNPANPTKATGPSSGLMGGSHYQLDIIEQTTILQSQLNEAQEEYNNLILEQANLKPGKKRFKEIEKEKAAFEETSKSVKKIIADNLSIISDQYGTLFDSSGKVIAGYEDTVERIDILMNLVTSDTEALFNNIVDKYSDVTKVLKELGEQGKVTAEDLKDEKYKDFIQNLIDIGLIADDTVESLELVADAFNNISVDKSTGEVTELIKGYRNVISDYKKILSDAQKLGVDANKTVFGNIDLNNRKVLEWNEENLNLYKDAIKSWEDANKSWGEIVDDWQGSTSTVFGSTGNYDGIDIAFSPMLQTKDGAVLLSSDTVDKYIWGLIDKAGEGWTNKELFELDTEGLEIDGLKISNLLADIGETADKTSQQMHFLGKDGALSGAINELKEYAWVLENEIYAKRTEGADTSALEAELQEVKKLITGYGGLTDAYNSWKATTEKDSTRENDIYKDVGASYKEMKKLIDSGWYGDESLDEYLDMLIAADKRTGDIAKDFDLLSKKIEGTNHSIVDYWQYDKDGNLSSLGLFKFLDDVKKKLGETFAGTDENGGYYFDFTGDRIKEVADAFGLSTEAVEMFVRALKTAGMAVDLSDIDLIGTIDEVRTELKELQSEGWLSSGLDLDFNIDIDDLEDVKNTIEELEAERLTIDGETNPEIARQLDSLISKVKQQYYIRLNAETDGSLDAAVQLVNELREKTYGTYRIDTVAKNSKEVSDLIQQISELPEETQIAIGIKADNVGDVESIINQFASKDGAPKIPVEFTPNTEAADAYFSYIQTLQFENKEVEVGVKDKSTEIIDRIRQKITNLPKTTSLFVTTYHRNVYEEGLGGSGGRASGTLASPSRALANGSAYNLFNLKPAYANGRIALSEDELALVNEIGTESIIRDGRWFLIPGGIHQEALKKGDIILSAAQTKALLRTGAAAGRGRSYADGSILGAYPTGSGGSLPKYSKGGYTNAAGKTTKNTVSQKTAKKSTSNKKSDEESEFERLYKYHQHLLAMDAESVEDYLNWLNDAYKVAYKNNEIELDDYYKFEEETYKGLQDLFKDYLDDIEHEISMRENFKGEAKAIVKLYQQMIDAVQAEIKAARAAGLKDTDDYIQDLQDKYWDYYDAIKDIRDDTAEAAKDAVDELIDYRIDMLKKEADKEKDKIQERLTYLRDFYQKQKDLLKDVYDEDKYYEDQAEKRKAVTDIQAELAKIEYDNSAWAQKRRLELAEDLAKAQKDLDDFEKDHALEVAQEQLDKQLEMQEKALEAETDAIDKSLESAKDIYERALADIRNGSVELYQEMIEYNNLYGDGISESITNKWQDAYVALKDYFDLFDEHYKGVNLANATGYRNPTEPSTSWDTHPISGYEPKGTAVTFGESTVTTQAGGSGAIDDAVKQKVAAAIWRGGYGWGSGAERAKRLEEVFGANNGIQALVNKGVGKGAAAPGSEYTYLNMRKKYRGYASGTGYATAGIHAIDERGTETIFESANGTRYKLFTGGEKVLNAEASNFLYSFANNGSAILSELLKKAATSSVNNVRPIATNININEGNIVIQGDASRETVSEIRRVKRESMDNLLKEINRLNKF